MGYEQVGPCSSSLLSNWHAALHAAPMGGQWLPLHVLLLWNTLVAGGLAGWQRMRC